jgi:hypothetical protein
MENLTVKEINFIIDCLKLKEHEHASEAAKAIIIGALEKGETEEKAKKVSVKLKEINEKIKQDEEQVTIIKAKLYMLRDKLNQEKITKDANDIIS